MKKCKICKKEKSVNDFYKNKANKDGLRGKCRQCFSVHRKIYYIKNRKKKLLMDKISYKKRRKKILEQKKQYYKKNKTLILEKSTRYGKINKKVISIKRKKFYQNNKPEILNQRKNYRINNKELISKKAKMSYPLHRQDRLNYRYKKEYGITYQDVMDIFKDMKGKCPLCDKDMHMNGVNNKRAVVDHDHKSGIIRGIICSKCNRGIGHFNDDPTLLLKVVAYLQNSPLTKQKKSAKVVNTNTV